MDDSPFQIKIADLVGLWQEHVLSKITEIVIEGDVTTGSVLPGEFDG